MRIYYIDFDNFRIETAHFEAVGNLYQIEYELDEIYEVWFYSNSEARRYLRELKDDEIALF